MEPGKSFDNSRDSMSDEEMQAMEILQKVYNHELTPFGGLTEMNKILEAQEQQQEELPAISICG